MRPLQLRQSPEATIAAFNDHGTLRRTIDDHTDAAAVALKRLAAAGIDLTSVAEQLEERAIAAFTECFEDALAMLDAKGACPQLPGHDVGQT
jgi:transaldolase